VFTGLNPGSCRLGLYKFGFFPTPGAGSALVNLVGGEERADIDLTMSRGAVLAGRVFDASGKPLRNVGVGALRVGQIARLDQTMPSIDVDRTNESGEFRVQSLPPGRYVIVANATSGLVSAPANGSIDSITYFPGTFHFLSALQVEVGPAATVDGLDFIMMTAPAFGVSGVAVDDFGRHVSNALVTLNTDRLLFGGPKGSSQTDAEGRFRIGFIAAGDYRLTVTPPDIDPKPITRRTPFVRVRVVDTDVSGVAIQVPSR
jgi:hypothetical protein